VIQEGLMKLAHVKSKIDLEKEASHDVLTSLGCIWGLHWWKMVGLVLDSRSAIFAGTFAENQLSASAARPSIHRLWHTLLTNNRYECSSYRDEQNNM
jgi:hypothetical protein